MKIREVGIYRHGQATPSSRYSCLVTFTVTTANQFTDEEHTIQHGSRWLLTAFLGGLFVAWRTGRRLAAKRGERAAKGWAP